MNRFPSSQPSHFLSNGGNKGLPLQGHSEVGAGEEGRAEADFKALDDLRRRLNGALLGKEAVIEHVLSCLLAQGHLLLEDLPGLGKTTLAKALSDGLGGVFARVQCTPDLLPGDITGFSIFNAQSREFEFRPGPVFSDVLLVDEINRATPRTQSSLLEAMAEGQVTVDNTRHALGETFFVIATQNPVEQHGTYPLPEAQLDRFAMRLSVGYPGRHHEIAMLEAACLPRFSTPSETVVPTLDTTRLRALQEQVRAITVAPKLREYLVSFGEATRSHARIHLGLSPRGLLVWQRVAQARALLAGRSFVIPDDIQDVAVPVLGVRLAGEFSSSSGIVEELLASVPLPAYAT